MNFLEAGAKKQKLKQKQNEWSNRFSAGEQMQIKKL